MTLPNKLTMLRIILIPVMVIIYYIPFFSNTYVFKLYGGIGFFYGLSISSLIMFVIFALASITDFLDGAIARKYNLITSFGKFADPLADKMLVFTAMTLLMLDVIPYHDWYSNIMPAWAFIVMLIREFMVSGIRMVAAVNGEAIAAGMSGKLKTVVTMIAIIVLFICGLHDSLIYIGQILIYIATILTVISGIEYFIKGKKYILESI
jgi:CDP-diacylglycerol--glycerol-3-phosphate 3-phosphatidyltransferase